MRHWRRRVRVHRSPAPLKLSHSLGIKIIRSCSISAALGSAASLSAALAVGLTVGPTVGPTVGLTVGLTASLAASQTAGECLGESASESARVCACVSAGLSIFGRRACVCSLFVACERCCRLSRRSAVCTSSGAHKPPLEPHTSIPQNTSAIQSPASKRDTQIVFQPSRDMRAEAADSEPAAAEAAEAEEAAEAQTPQASVQHL